METSASLVAIPTRIDPPRDFLLPFQPLVYLVLSLASPCSYGALGYVPPGAWPCTSIWQFLFTYKLISIVVSENHAISPFNHRLTDSQSLKLAYMTHNLKKKYFNTYLLSYLCHWKYTSSMTFNCKLKAVIRLLFS